MQDSYSTNLGDGLVREFDHGAIFYTKDGIGQDFCARCTAMVDEHTLDEDRLCTECHAYDRECQECGKVFEDKLEWDEKGRPICDDCWEIKLAKIKPVPRIDMVDMARKLCGMERKAV